MIIPSSPYLDAYATQRCQVRLQHSFDDHLTVVRRPLRDAEQHRIDSGHDHEADVLAILAKELGDAMVLIDNDDRTTAQFDTLDALTRGVPVIAKSWLPADEEGRRIGRPDLLVKNKGGYVPIEIKLHLLSTDGNGALDHSPLTTPFPSHATPRRGKKFRKGALWFTDALQLAHYWRMLDAMGFIDADDGVLGGVIDGAQELWWIDLDATHGRTQKRPLEAYDGKFAESIGVVDATIARNIDPSLPRAREPWWHKECEGCPYSEICYEELDAVDDVSLVRWLSPEALIRLKAQNVTTRATLAALDLDVVDLGASLNDTTMPLPELLDQARLHQPDETLDEVVGRRMGVRRRVAAAKMDLVRDLVNRDATSLLLAGTVRDLGRSVRRARAGVAGGVARQVAAEDLDAARADVEVDIDMESYEGATYLWGAHVTCNVASETISEGYRAFATFEPLSEQREAELFGEFWIWLTDLRDKVRSQGLTFRSYCFWHPAEEGQMRRAVRIGAEGLPRERELDLFFESDEWVDLHFLCKEQLVTEGPLGLKTMATFAGFSWRDEDPSGEASIVWYEEAQRENTPESRQRLLEYNEDDVLATRALRVWLDGPARALPHVDDITAPPVA